MKKLDPLWHRTGLCHVCGRPTKLLIHSKCGEQMEAMKKETRIGVGGLTKRHAENAKHNQAKKNWAKGKLPPGALS